MFLNVCEQSQFLSVILFIKMVIDLIQIVIPVILIIMCAIDIAKIVINPEEKSVPRVVKRMITAVIVFFVPAFLNILLDAAGQTAFTATTCWTNANTATIATLRANEEAEREAQRKADQEADEKRKKEQEAKEEYEEAEEYQEEEESDTYLKENGTDGKVTVIDGVFYKPSSGKSGAAGTKGSGPYGYNIYFYNRLKKFVDDAKAEGHDIRMSTSEYGAWRPLENQEYFWNCYQTKKCNNGNLAAYPGRSNHGWGIASDLSYGSGSHGRQAALYWAHDNASKYGLEFPLCQNIRGYCQENWHIEPTDLKSK